jgi:hypothetical protein
MATTLKKQVLINARALIANPAHWTMWVLAASEHGRPVSWHDRAARRWCAVGAIHRAAFDLLGDKERAIALANEVIARIYPHTPPRRNLPALNDTQGHAAVIGLFDRALRDESADSMAAKALPLPVV